MIFTCVVTYYNELDKAYAYMYKLNLCFSVNKYYYYIIACSFWEIICFLLKHWLKACMHKHGWLTEHPAITGWVTLRWFVKIGIGCPCCCVVWIALTDIWRFVKLFDFVWMALSLTVSLHQPAEIDVKLSFRIH